jgi:hypothetical protein
VDQVESGGIKGREQRSGECHEDEDAHKHDAKYRQGLMSERTQG